MTDPILALRTAIRDRLVADAALTAALGGPRVFDETPRDAVPPYVTFGEARAADWRNGGEGGREHLLALHVWSSAAGDREALAIAARVTDLLHDAALAPAGHRLVLIRLTSQETQRPGRDGLRRVLLRWRALTEPA